MRFWTVLILISGICTALSAESQSGIYLRANQVGYLPSEQKVVLAWTNQSFSGQSFQVVNSQGSNAFTGVVGLDRGKYGNFNHLYELDFSPVKTPGRFTVRISGVSSTPFIIGSETYSPLIPKSLTFFRVQRCGNTSPIKHKVCHLKDGFAAGGWHDAGDYLKFTITTSAAVNLMLTAYDRHPAVFKDANNNKRPDVLDESLTGLDWLYRMWDPSHNTLYFQVGDESDHEKWRMPEVDDKNGVVRKVFSCASGKGANVAGKVAASLALAAQIWSDPQKSFADPALAETYLTAAKQIYDFGKKNQATQPGNPFYNETSWRDDMALAAIQLYRATHTASYLNEARSFGKSVQNGWTFDWSEMHSLAHYEIGRTDPSYRATAIQFLKRDIDSYQSKAKQNPFRAALESFYWGSAAVMVGQALEMLWYEDLSGDHSYHNLAQQQRDFVLGANPWGVCWVNSAGKNWSRHPHHQIADITGTQLVGFWNEGPDTKKDWMQFKIQLQKPDQYSEFQSDAAIYHDDVEDYVTNEPTIFANGVGIALVSWY
jgi:endoglucanase